MASSVARPDKPLLSAVVPFLNEATNLPRLISELENVFAKLDLAWELILIDDGSGDESLEIAKRELRMRPNMQGTVLSLTRNFGKEAALTAGLEAANGDVIVPLDADLQDPPELIAEMLDRWRRGYDVVYAVRKRRSGDSTTKKLTAQGFYRLMRWLSSTAIPADTGDFRLMDRCVVDALAKMPERNRFMKGLFAWVGFSQISVEYDRVARKHGKSAWTYWKLWNFALDGITSFSRVPLQVLSGSGLLIAAIAMLYGSWMVLRTILFGIDLPGYASLMTAVLLLGGMQLLGLGMLGEYLGRVFEEVKQRPLYLVRERWSNNVDTVERTK